MDLPEGLGRHIHQNRLLKVAREGGQMTPKDLGKFEPQRRYATLAAVVLESTATVIDEPICTTVSWSSCSVALSISSSSQKQGKAIKDKVRLYSKIGQALLESKESGSDPYCSHRGGARGGAEMNKAQLIDVVIQRNMALMASPATY